MLNLYNLFSALSVLFGSASTDFFNKEVGKEPLVFKMWMIIVIAVSCALLVILAALLIAVSVKEKKQSKLDEENTDENEAQNASENSVQENVSENVTENAPVQENVEENADEVAPVQENVGENADENEVPESADEVNENNDGPSADVVDTNDSNELESQNEVENAENNSEEVNNEEENVEVAAENVVEENQEVAVDTVDNEENNETVVENAVVENITDETDKEEQKETMDKQVKDEANAKVVLGRLDYYLTESGWYFSLYANNGQQLFVSYSYTTQDGAMKGFDTFAKAVLEGNFKVSEDKNGRFRYILNKKYQGPNYKTKAQCENAIISVKKFSQNYKVNIVESTPELETAFALYLENLKKAKDIDMDEIAKEEANTPKSGAFEIEEVDDGYRFYLYANNRQILYTSNIYASPVSARNGIDAFKKAVYGGVVVIEKDKFSNYRYILRNSTTVTYAGESYESEASARKSFESVKRFVKSATIVPFKKKVEGEDAE